MNPVPSFSEQSNYLNCTLSIAAAKSGDFGAATWFVASSYDTSSVSDVVDELSTETETAGWGASTWSRSEVVDELSKDSETAGEWSNESSGLARGECEEMSVGKQLEEERQDVRQDWPVGGKTNEPREGEPKENDKFDEKILRNNYIQMEPFDNQKPPRPPSSGKTSASDSSQISKFKRFKKRVFHMFPKEHKSKTDSHLLLMTSYSQNTEVSTMTDSITHNMSAYSQSTGASSTIQSIQSPSVKESSELDIEIDNEAANENYQTEDERSIQRKRARFQVFTRIASPHSNPSRTLYEKKPVDKVATVPSSDSPVDQIETVLSSDSDHKEIKIMEADGNDIVMSQISPRTYVVKDDSNSIAVLSVQAADETEIFFICADAICCSKRENNFSFDDENSIDSTFDGQSDSSASLVDAVETIQKHAALLGISEHELLDRHDHD
jgi:hypothetical protein